jgi:hypothetical protein
MELKQELNNQRPRTAAGDGGDEDWEDEKIGLQLEIEQLQARCNAIEDESIN